MTATPATAGPHWASAIMARQVEALGQLAEDGILIAKALRDEILEVPRDDAPDATPKTREERKSLGRAWERTVRAVRLCYLLQEKVIGDIDALARGEAVIEARKGRVQKIMCRIIDDQRPFSRERMERLVAERLDADFCGDILTRPISELVEIISRDLKVDAGWPGLSQEPWAQAEIASGEVGWPLAPYAAAADDAALQRQPVQALSP